MYKKPTWLNRTHVGYGLGGSLETVVKGDPNRKLVEGFTARADRQATANILLPREKRQW